MIYRYLTATLFLIPFQLTAQILPDSRVSDWLSAGQSFPGMDIVLDDFSGPRLNPGTGEELIKTYSGEDEGQAYTIADGLLEVSAAPKNCGGRDCGIYWHFFPYPYTGTGGFAKGWIESGTWDTAINRMRFKFKCDKNIPKTSSGYGNIQVGTYVKRDDGNPSNQGAHFYHLIDPNIYNDTWVYTSINRTPQHQVGMSGGSDWPEDPLWDGGAGVHYFDGLTRWYFDTQADFSGATCQFAPVTFALVAGEPDQQVSSVTYQYSGTRYEVTWSGPKNSDLLFDVAYKTSSMKESGFLSGVSGGTIAATGNDYTNVIWTSPPMDEDSAGLFVAILPQGQSLFTEVHIPYSAHPTTTNIRSLKSRKSTLFYNAPFNRFDVTIHNPGPYSFTVYDLSGKIISDLFLDLKVPGSYRIVPQYKHHLKPGIYGAKLTGQPRLEKYHQTSVIFAVVP